MKILQFFYTLFFVLLFSTATFAGKIIPIDEPKKDNFYASNIATQWMNHITDWIRDETLTPPPTLRIFAYTGLAMYESQLPGMKDYQSLYTYFTGSKIVFDNKIAYSPTACANAAIAEILRKLQLLKNHNKQIDSLELVYYNLYKHQTNSKQLQVSVDFGKQVADSIFEWSKTDGTFTTYLPHISPVGTGLWEPSPGKQPMPVPVGVYQGLLRTFCKGITTLADPGPPPPFSTDTASVFYKNAWELMNVSKNLSQDDSLLVLSWKVIHDPRYLNTLTHITKLLTGILEKENYPLLATSIMYAKNGMAMFDAVAACFKAKYRYNILSPVTYIDKYLGISDWASFYFYNPYPSYPTVVPAAVAASGFIFEQTFGMKYPITDSTQAALEERRYNSINEWMDDACKNRIVGGLDFPFSVTAGKAQGRKVGEMINVLPFKKPL